MPAEARKKENESAVWENTYGDMFPLKTPQPFFKKGDTVRIFKQRGKFKRGYTANYTDELFQITEVLDTTPTTYKIADSLGETIVGSFYPGELSQFNSR